MFMTKSGTRVHAIPLKDDSDFAEFTDQVSFPSSFFYFNKLFLRKSEQYDHATIALEKRKFPSS